MGQRSNWWYLLPIFFSLIGGIIGYFAIRKDDPQKAKNILIAGIVIFIITIILNVIKIFKIISIIAPPMSLMS